ncbi:MAG: hypothetical protein HOC05_11040 [Gemmatimonadetes bacterium]|nr:hypothetical protein [Gemmatimonadota bacterium]
MATIEAWEQARDSFTKTLEQLRGTDIDSLMKSELGTSSDFLPYRGLIERVVESAAVLSAAPISEWPAEFLKPIQTHAAQLNKHFEEILGFQVGHDTTPMAWRDQKADEVTKRAAEFFKFALPLLAYEQARQALEPAIQAQHSRVMDEVVAKAQSQVGEIADVLEKARQAAQQTGIAQYARLFETEAKTHKTRARRWYLATIGSVAGLLLYGGLLLYRPFVSAGGTVNVVASAIPRIVLLGSLYYAVHWCARNFSAHCHNEVVNRHRVNSLGTFETFAKAAGDDTQTKNAVLLEATHSIFGSQSSGFFQREAPPVPQNKIVEIMRNIGSRSSS